MHCELRSNRVKAKLKKERTKKSLFSSTVEKVKDIIRDYCSWTEKREKASVSNVWSSAIEAISF